MARVAVVGGGLFGTTAAIHVARRGHAVHLFEEKSDLLRSASTINQYRIHRGYHYPRSPETTQSCIAGVSSFVEEYRDAVVADSRHLYGIAREDSKTSLSQFMQHCDAHGLFYRAVSAAELINPERADAVEVVEDSLDPGALGTLVKRKPPKPGVEGPGRRPSTARSRIGSTAWCWLPMPPTTACSPRSGGRAGRINSKCARSRS